MRRSDLVEVGRQVRLKRNIGSLLQLLSKGIDGYTFDFYVLRSEAYRLSGRYAAAIKEDDTAIGRENKIDTSSCDISSD